MRVRDAVTTTGGSMKHAFVVALVITIGATLSAVSVSQAAIESTFIHGGDDRSSWVGPIQKIKDNVYWIPGAGSNTLVYVHANGVVLVDTKVPNYGQVILERVRSVTDKPITHIINTHYHSDHIGSNTFFPASVEVVAHENTAKYMQALGDFTLPYTRHGLPDRTYQDRMTLLSGDDAIDLYYLGAAHTDGDAFVYFRKARVLATGDAFAYQSLPNIDFGHGGSGIAFPETIAKVASTFRDAEVVVGAHSATPFKPRDVADYAEFLRLMAQHARTSFQQGKSPQQAFDGFSAILPAKFKGYALGLPTVRPGGGVFVVLFDELRKQAAGTAPAGPESK